MRARVAAAPSARSEGAASALTAGLVAGALSLLLFALTAGWTVASHDVAQFQTLARTGGIAHAGYPALIMALEALDRLPFFPPPYRANLVSVLSGALAVGAAAWCGARLAGRALAGLLPALGLALSITLWTESTHAGVHAFTLALGAFVYVLAVRLAARPRGGEAFAVGLLAGLGLVSHLTILAVGPVVLAAGVLAARSGRLRPRHVGLAAAGLLVGLAPLLYLIACDRPEQPMNYIHDTLRPDNAAELSGGSPPIGRVARAAWLLSARQYLGGFVFSPFADAGRRTARLVLGGLLNDLPLWGIPLAIHGAWVLWRRRDRQGLFLALWLSTTVVLVLYAAVGGMERIFFLPGLWVGSQLVAASLGALGRRSRPAATVAGGLLILTPLLRVSVSEPPGPLARVGIVREVWRMGSADWSPWAPDRSWDAYGRGVMQTLPPRAVVLACWSEATTLRYFRYGEVLREDVDILYHCKVPRPAFAAADSAGRPIFTTYEPTAAITGGRGYREVGRWARGGLWRIAGPAGEGLPAPR